MQVSRDGFSRRQSNQQILFSAVSYVFLFLLHIFAIQRELCSGYFWTSAIKTTVFNGTSEKQMGTLMDSDTLSSSSMCAVSRSVNWVLWVSSGSAGCEGIRTAQQAWTLCFHQQHYWCTICSQWFVCVTVMCVVKETLLVERNQTNSKILSTILQLWEF